MEPASYENIFNPWPWTKEQWTIALLNISSSTPVWEGIYFHNESLEKVLLYNFRKLLFYPVYFHFDECACVRASICACVCVLCVQTCHVKE